MTRSLDLICGGALNNPFGADEVVAVNLHPDGRPNVVTADLVIEPIPFPDASMDFVTAYDFVQFIPPLVYAPARRNAFVELMNEVSRVLKPGGRFMVVSAVYPQPQALRDPTQVNLITDETFPLYFAQPNRWATIYGFNGDFAFTRQKRMGEQLFVMLQKLPVLQAVADAPEDEDTLVAKVEASLRAKFLGSSEASFEVPKPKISVFIPVYNAGKYLAHTLDSLRAQNFTEFEAICIDDGSSDASLSVLNDYALRDERIRVLRTPQNLGTVPRVLNWALDEMRGDFFVYSSQDDEFSVDWLQKMHARALETAADAVVPDLVFYHEKEPEKNRTLAGVKGDRSRVLSGREAAYLSLDWTIPGNALWRAELVRRVKFFDFAMNADEYTSRVLYLNCNRVAFSEGQFRYRQDNANAITKKVTYKTFDTPYTFYRLYQLLKEHGFPAAICEAEVHKGIRALETLKPWLEAQRAQWPAEHVAEAEARIARAEQCLAETGLLTEPATA